MRRNLSGQVVLITMMLAKPALVSAQATEPQGSTKERQKVEQSGADPRTVKALFQAIHENNVERAQEILSQGFDVNVNYGFIPLNVAASRGHKEMVTLLLKHGAAVDAADNQGLAPLHYAAAVGHIDIVKILIAQEPHIDIEDNAGRAPIHYAAEANYRGSNPQKWSVEVIQLLIDADADINLQDDMGWTPLHYAARGFKQYLIEVLVENGAAIDVVDNHGCTPFVVMQKAALHLRELRGSAYETTIPRDLMDDVRNASRFLYKSNCVYVVATNGKDAHPGTLRRPFRTIAAAMEIVMPGDTILVRGGTYRCSSTIHLNRSGEQGSPIRLAAYPGEFPILDSIEVRGESISIQGAYWHIKGLSITNAMRPIMIHGGGAHHNVLEQVRSFDNQGAIYISADGPAYNVVLNCDAYRNFDFMFNGEGCDGFQVIWNVGPGNVLIGNRSWNNSDDGYDMWYANNSVRLERCYAWGNGINIWDHPFFEGNGNGFKLGKGTGKHVLIRCIAWRNPHRGFDQNANSEGVQLINCTGWNNFIDYFFNRPGSSGSLLCNDISFKESSFIGIGAISQFNSWDAELGLTLTDDDFLSLDDSAMTQPRNPDGSIPQNDFLRLAPGSTAIDKGTDVGMPFVGQRPDLGAFEYDSNAPSQAYVKMLHQYVRDRDITKIKELLAQGEGINDKDWLGYTPLQWAVYFGYPDVVELLISSGADPHIQSDTGRYALEIAKAMEYDSISELIGRLKANSAHFRKPANDEEMRYWLENMIWHHHFTDKEVAAATGLTNKEIDAAKKKFDIRADNRPEVEKYSTLRVLPYPGGRHPRIGFLEGAIDPQRETKFSVFTPWDPESYVVVDVPEAIWSNLGLTYLAHTHIDTIWTEKGINLAKLEWKRLPGGTLEIERELPNGITFGVKVKPTDDAVRMEMWLRNGTKQRLTDLRIQNCVMPKMAAAFEQQSNDNKVLTNPYAACRSDDGKRWIITAWEGCHRPWANPDCPCFHSDPKFPDLAPGETGRLRGWLSFYEGTDIEAEFKRIESIGWRSN